MQIKLHGRMYHVGATGLQWSQNQGKNYTILFSGYNFIVQLDSLNNTKSSLKWQQKKNPILEQKLLD